MDEIYQIDYLNNTRRNMYIYTHIKQNNNNTVRKNDILDRLLVWMLV